MRRQPQTICLLAAACGLAVVVIGCTPKKQPTHTAQPNPQANSMTDADARMTELRKRAVELTNVTQQLPADQAAKNRALVADAFGKSAGALELLGGPTPGG